MDTPQPQAFAPRQHMTMTEMAVSVIRAGILSGEFLPETRLIPGALEAKLNLGRVPIREALKELAGSGLVKLLPNRGAVVAPILTVDELHEVFELRYDLEGKAAYRAAQRITQEQLDHLHVLNEVTHTALQPRAYTQANRTFHLELYRTAGWHFLHKMITELYDQMLSIRVYFPPDITMVEHFTHEHAQILEALARRDAEAARERTQQHIYWLFGRLKELTKNGYPPLPAADS